MENFDWIDNEFKVLKAIGKGYTSKVLLTHHIKSNTPVAVKIYRPRKELSLLEQEFENEVTTMKSVQHKNVLKIYAANNEGIYRYDGNRKNPKPIIYLGVEVCSGGEFFDYIKDPGKGFNEKISRYYFHQIVEGLRAVHASGISHRDLKTENMFLDDKYNIKIGDFGFAKYCSSSNSKFTSHLGTPGYQSPQMLMSKNYNGFDNDCFALGVILFVIHAGSPPFREAKSTDPWYKNLLSGNAQIFWGYHLKHRTFSKNFIKLVHGLISPENRFTLKDVIASDWYNEEVASEEEVIKEMEERKIIVLKERSNDNLQIEIDSDDTDTKEKKNYRDVTGDIEERLKDIEIDEESIQEWSSQREGGNQIKVQVSHYKIYLEIARLLASKYEGVTLDLNNNCLKLNAKYYKYGEENEVINKDGIELDSLNLQDVNMIDINIDIYKNGKEGSVVQVNKNEEMSQFDFRVFYRELANDLKKK